MTIKKMKAPKDVSSANIQGHTYEVPKNGVIRVLSETHIPDLVRHGFSEHHEEPVDIAAAIDAMDDKDELVTFIEERGGEADTDLSLKKLKRLAREAAGVEE